MFRKFSFWLKTFFVSSILAVAATIHGDPGTLESDKFIVFTPYKCGTHLVGKLLGLMLDRTPEYHLEHLGSTLACLQTCKKATAGGAFAVAHEFKWASLNLLAKDGYKIIFILRDPRDQLVSLADWILEGQWPQHRLAQITDEEFLITEMITGETYDWHCYEKCIESRMNCVRKFPSNIFCITHFEDLVGPEGGGDSAAQIKEILRLAAFLNIDFSTERAEAVAGEVFGGTWTFRKGHIGSWKERFTPEQKQLYKSIYADVLIKLGYEKDYSW